MRRRSYSFVIRPNCGLEIDYQRKLDREIDAMHRSIQYWIRARYREHLPRIASDARPANALSDEMDDLGRQWLARFDKLSGWLAKYFALKVADRTDRALIGALRRGGMSVRLQHTRAQSDALAAIVHENVSLIKSIATQHLSAVEGAVMRSVLGERDLEVLTTELRERWGVTKRRAALIAKQQNNSATGQLHAIRQTELGLESMWLHSRGDKVPRPTHLANSGKTYDPAKGWYDPAEMKFIRPGELIGCTCTSRSVVRGFS